MRQGLRRVLAAIGLTSLLSACAHTPPTIQPVANVDLQRFMGTWYVIAHIPTRFERDAFAATETYALRSDGRIATTFSYRKGSVDGPEHTMHPVGTVRDSARGAVWDMRFFGFLSAEYVIVYLKDDYSLTIIGRSDRDYAWVMARTPHISEDDYVACEERLRRLGYSLDALRRVPQPPILHKAGG